MKMRGRQVFVIVLGLLLGLLGALEPWSRSGLWRGAKGSAGTLHARRGAHVQVPEIVRVPRQENHPDIDPLLLPMATPPRDHVRA
jgi:hypothetical protein